MLLKVATLNLKNVSRKISSNELKTISRKLSKLRSLFSVLNRRLCFVSLGLSSTRKSASHSVTSAPAPPTTQNRSQVGSNLVDFVVIVVVGVVVFALVVIIVAVVIAAVAVTL